MKTAQNAALINVREYAEIRSRRPLLIAHRGGVIAANAPENSLAAIDLAAQQGYDMVELDACAARDREPVLFHGNQGNLRADCGVDKHITELTSQELQKLRYRASDQHIATLEQALEQCACHRLGVMLDIKDPEESRSRAFFERLASLLKQHQLTNATVTISHHPFVEQYLSACVLPRVSPEDFQKVQQGQDVPLKAQFWFGLPEDLPDPAVELLQRNGTFVIPALNVFRYPAHAHYQLARLDAQRLLAAGVEGFQIDSVYTDIFSPGSV